MIFLAGKSIALDRMKADKPGISPDISVDHDYYGQGENSAKHPLQGPKQADEKAKEVKEAIKPSGYEVGYDGRMGLTHDKGDVVSGERVKKAIGGSAKERLGMTDD
jgi:hypothetical protein